MKYVLLLVLALLQVAVNIILRIKRHSRVSRIFTYFTGVLLIWTITNTTLDYLTYGTHTFADQHTRQLILNVANRFGFFAGALILIVLYRLFLIFPRVKERTRLSDIVTLIGAGIAVLTFFPVLSGTYTVSAHEIVTYHYGPAYLLIAAYFVLVSGLLVANLVQSLRQQLDPLVRRQAKSIVTALLLTGVWAILFILILPAFFNVGEDTLFIGYFSPFIFTSVLLYSIFKQGFLNYRIIVARAVGYMLSLGAIVGLFVLLTLGLFRTFGTHYLSVGEALIFAVCNILTAMIFPPTKRFFNRATNRLFYRDAYDSQALLDKLNRLFVAYTNVDGLLKRSAITLLDTMKCEFCYFVLQENDEAKKRLVGPQAKNLSTDDLQLIATNLLHVKENLIITDELEESKPALYAVLQANNIAILGQLNPSGTKEGAGSNYLVLGARRSGNPYTIQDIRTLQIIVNELVIAIENSLRFEEIQRFNQTLQENVNEATHKLRRTNEKLQALDATKDEFITMASHQLRTPLTSVKGYLSMVLEGDAGKLNKQQEELLTQSYVSSQRMVYLISDLLNLSRLNTGKFVIEPSPVDLTEVVQSEIDQLRETAKSRDVALVYERPASLPKLMLDETKIHQVVMNFIDNAIYYTPSGGSITVRLRETPVYVEYTVKDTGIGVPRTEQHKLFTKFYRAGNARKARPDGTGLGLFMAKKVIAAQGGAIIFDSVEGKGSTFGFRFSKAHHLAASQPAPAPAPAVAQV